VSVLRAMFTRQWLLATFLVVTGSLVMVRLGYWQLDRLEQRRAFNTRVQAQIDEEPLDLNQALVSDQTSQFQSSLHDMEYRTVLVEGEFDHTQEVVLRNQAWNNQLGVRLLTPLKISGTQQSILVDRGWVPYEDYTAGRLDKYRVAGIQQVQGRIRRSQVRPDIGTRTDPNPGESDEPLQAFFLANVDRIAVQVPYPLLPVYVQWAPDGTGELPPHRSAFIPELTEGSHLGYALQWFTFAVILAAGYPFFVKREMTKPAPVEKRNEK
jgi:surfeit locus 1 family protein